MPPSAGLPPPSATPRSWPPTRCTARWRARRVLASGWRRARAAIACWSRCRAGSTAPSRRCSSASAAPRWSAVTLKLWADRRPTAPRPAARPRRCSAPARSPTRSASRTSRSTSRRSFAAASSTGSSTATRRGGRRTPASSATARCGSTRCSTSPSGSAPTRLVTGHYARIVDDGDGPLLAAGGRRGQGPELHARRAAAASCSPGSRFPLAELTKPEVREIAARHGLAGRPQAREPGPLLPRRPGQGAASCAATAACATARATIVDRSGRALGRHRGHHNFTVGQRRGLGVAAPRAALRARHRRGRQHGHRRHPRGAGDQQRAASATRSCTATARASTRSGCATARAPSRPRSRRAGRGRHEALELELGEAFAGASPGPDRVLMDGETIVGHGTIAAAA